MVGRILSGGYRYSICFSGFAFILTRKCERTGYEDWWANRLANDRWLD